MRLALFFSKKISIRKWRETGIYDRETALYRKHADKGIYTTFVTYDRELPPATLPAIEHAQICFNRLRLHNSIYHLLCPILHAKDLANCDVIKTNQSSGSLPAVVAAKIFQKPLVARCGYLQSELMAVKRGRNAPKTKRILGEEHRLFTNADAIIVTTPSMRQNIVARIPSTKQRITVIPNYVDTSLFRPMPVEKKTFDIVFIGRISREKNLEALLDAAEMNDCSVLLIGSGPDEAQLKQRYRSNKILWKGNLPNHELPVWINRAKIFMLTSHHEGNPKVLLEAMACGCAAIGANAPGIREVIVHGKTGLLSNNDVESLAVAITDLLQDDGLRSRIGENARTYALEHFSLEVLAEQEHKVLESVLSAIRPGIIHEDL